MPEMTDTPEFEYSPEFHLPGEYLSTEQIVKTWHKPRDIVPGICFESSVGMIVAPPYVGKTLLLMDLGLALASNQPWLKWKPVAQVPAIIYALDSPGWESREQAICLMAGRGMDPAKPWPFALVTRELVEQMRPCDPTGEPLMSQPLLGPFDIMNQRWFHHITITAIQYGARLIGLDSMSKIHTRDENSRDEMEAVMKQVARLAMLTRAHVCILHHTPVMDRGENVYAGRGSSAIAASVDFKAVIAKTGPKTCKFVVLKGRGSDEGDSEFTIAKHRVAGTSIERAVRWEVLPEMPPKPKARDLAWAEVQELLQSGPLTRRELIVKAAEHGLDETVDRYLTRFRDQGMLYSPGRGSYGLTDRGKTWTPPQSNVTD